MSESSKTAKGKKESTRIQSEAGYFDESDTLERGERETPTVRTRRERSPRKERAGKNASPTVSESQLEKILASERAAFQETVSSLKVSLVHMADAFRPAPSPSPREDFKSTAESLSKGEVDLPSYLPLQHSQVPTVVLPGSSVPEQDALGPQPHYQSPATTESGKGPSSLAHSPPEVLTALHRREQALNRVTFLLSLVSLLFSTGSLLLVRSARESAVEKEWAQSESLPVQHAEPSLSRVVPGDAQSPVVAASPMSSLAAALEKRKETSSPSSTQPRTLVYKDHKSIPAAPLHGTGTLKKSMPKKKPPTAMTEGGQRQQDGLGRHGARRWHR